MVWGLVRPAVNMRSWFREVACFLVTPTLPSAGGCKGRFCPVLSLSVERGVGTPIPTERGGGPCPGVVVGWRPPPWAGPEGHRETAT